MVFNHCVKQLLQLLGYEIGKMVCVARGKWRGRGHLSGGLEKISGETGEERKKFHDSNENIPPPPLDNK